MEPEVCRFCLRCTDIKYTNESANDMLMRFTFLYKVLVIYVVQDSTPLYEPNTWAAPTAICEEDNLNLIVRMK